MNKTEFLCDSRCLSGPSGSWRPEKNDSRGSPWCIALEPDSHHASEVIRNVTLGLPSCVILIDKVMESTLCPLHVQLVFLLC